jgi:hypothetical protein
MDPITSSGLAGLVIGALYCLLLGPRMRLLGLVVLIGANAWAVLLAQNLGADPTRELEALGWAIALMERIWPLSAGLFVGGVFGWLIAALRRRRARRRS